jgi:cell division protein FtsW (lipid II flippase)
LIGLCALVFAGTTISIAATDMFTKLLAAGLTAFTGFQAIVNMGGVLRVLPMTGITLPFVSHGGWSLITSFAMLGILLAISHRNAAPQPIEKKAPQFVPVR